MRTSPARPRCPETARRDLPISCRRVRGQAEPTGSGASDDVLLLVETVGNANIGPYLGVPGNRQLRPEPSPEGPVMQKSGSTSSIVLLLVILIAGCDAVGDDDLQYSYTTERSHFTIEDSLTARFTNQSLQTVYVFQGCPTVDIEKRTDSTWTSVPFPFACTREYKPPRPVKPGEQRPFGVASRVLDAADVEPSTYRLTLSIGTTEDEPSQRAPSNAFEITE